jgi:putative spermidine/putrescine transport system permease protein
MSTPIHSGTWWTIARAVVCALVVIYLIAPMIIVLIISFSSAPFLTFPPPGFSLQWFRKLFGHAAWQDALLTSLQTAANRHIATVLGTAAVVGSLAAVFQARRSSAAR